MTPVSYHNEGSLSNQSKTFLISEVMVGVMALRDFGLFRVKRRT